MKRISRRNWVKQSLSLASLGAVGMPLGEFRAGQEADRVKNKLKVVVAGAHPDDPESGAGGTMTLYAGLSHEVVALYLTRGEAGIKGKSHSEAAAIRSAECEKACKILGARAVFAGQVDGQTEVTPTSYADFSKILTAEQPDLVFTHWPIDTHPDHRAVSLLVYDAWLRAVKEFALYYFEVETGAQTQNFNPTHYVDISSVEPRKRAACFAHNSQDPAGFYSSHEEMSLFRGMECGRKYAEAFIRHIQGPDDALLKIY